ncbi:MAG: RDD family protein [Alphaproteobacteria bacterium]|nr:RDD family protein [Alphaproteobacteria bacterium]
MSGAPELQPAPRWARFLAGLIDAIAVPLVAILVMLVTGVLEHAEDWVGWRPPVRIFLLGAAGYLLCNGWLLLSRAQTLGKFALGLQIVSARTGERAAFWRLLFLRSWFFPLPFLAVFGLLWLVPWIADLAFALRKDRRCLHDLLCGTAVVRR